MKNKKLISRLKSITKRNHWATNSWFLMFNNKVQWIHFKKLSIYGK